MRLLRCHLYPACAPALAILASLAFLLSTCETQAHEPIVRVEEQWEMVVGSADANSAAPQVVCTMSPSVSFDGLYFTFELNHQTLPEYLPGGLHLQGFADQMQLVSRSCENTSVMSTAGEVVRWTQILELHDGVLSFTVVEGSSETWGSFGEGNSLAVCVASDLEDLNAYSPDFSVENSGVSYGGNRVQSLAIRGVRLTLSDDQVIESTSLRTVHSLP